MVLNTHLTYAQAAAESLSLSMAQDESIIAMGEDLGRGGVFGQYQGLREKFGPERVIDTPISEAGIAGTAVGMALAGLGPSWKCASSTLLYVPLMRLSTKQQKIGICLVAKEECQ